MDAADAARSYALNEAMNQLVLAHLDPRAWRAKPPGARVRTIADMFCHMHNIRRKWLRLSAPHLPLPALLNRARCSQQEARTALAESGRRCCEMLSEAGGRVTFFHRDGWARPWPVDESMLAYMVAHDAHHRGQVCLLAHQLGYPLPARAAPGMWNWERLKP